MAASLYDRLGDFGTLVYTVGDGVDARTTMGLNDLSLQNAFQAADLTVNTRESLLFIAGGNGGSEHGRNADKLLPGSQPEAVRMVHALRERYGSVLPVITDCDPEYKEMFGLDPSHNTPENARNAVAIVEAGKMPEGDVVAENIHSRRVLATLLHAMRQKQVDALLRLHSVDAAFEPSNDQWHIRNKAVFRAWNMVGWTEHFLKGKVDRWEVVKEALTLRRFGRFREGAHVIPS